jgi:Sulfotransferase domain.
MRLYDILEEIIPATGKITIKAGLPHTVFDHCGAAFKHRRHYAQLRGDKSLFSNKKVLLLGRNIHDTLVSSYIHMSQRSGTYTGTLSDFIRDDYYGAVKFLVYYRQWYENQHIPRAFRFLRYENMHTDPKSVLISALEYIGVTDIDMNLLETAIQYASFDNLKQIESEYPFKVAPSQNDPANPESFKIRRGKVGGYVDYMSAEDIVYIDELNLSMGCEFTRPDNETAVATQGNSA